MQWSLILLFLMGESRVSVCRLYEYHYITEEKSWTEAQDYCREKHTDLATVTNMNDMKRILGNSPTDLTGAWIGLRDQTGNESAWRWSLPGEEYKDSETNWYPGLPKNNNHENCGGINNNTMWQDMRGSYTRYFLCFNESGTSQKYHLIKENKTFLEAQSYCRENHTDLVSGLKQLKDPQLNQTVLDGYKTQSTYIYIGLFKDSWNWSDGSSFSFRHWNLQFDMDKLNTGQCAMIGSADGGRWKNESCAERKHFICYEKKMILVKQNKSWEEAQKYCREHYLDLISITNPDVQKLVEEEVKKASSDSVWIGLQLSCTLDLWFWVNDALVCDPNWATDEVKESCSMSGAMMAAGNHEWVKRNDTDEFNFICSKR